MPVDVTRNAPGMPQLPIDPNVKIPDSVKRAAALADSYYQAAAAPAPEPTPTPAPEPTQNVAPEPPPAPQPTQIVAPEPTPAPQAMTSPAAPEPPAEPEWEHRYRSMKGRYDASQAVIGQMQEQMTMLGQELSRTQRLLMSPPTQQTQPQTLITDADKQNYGDDLIDLTRRAALDAVKPELNKLEQDNNNLRQSLQQQKQQAVVDALTEAMPDWREINRSSRFKQWLSLPDIYSGVVKQQLLNDAYRAASAPRVLAFFKDFVRDEVATGNIEPPAPVGQPQAAPQRQAAVSLEQIAAPGKVRPAGGTNTPTPASDKPIYTRAQIARFYSQPVRNSYVGRDAERAAEEQRIFAAQREGRIR